MYYKLKCVDKIETIKTFRVVFGLGLREAKDLVEKLHDTGTVIQLTQRQLHQIYATALESAVYRANHRLAETRTHPALSPLDMRMPFVLSEESVPDVVRL